MRKIKVKKILIILGIILLLSGIGTGGFWGYKFFLKKVPSVKKKTLTYQQAIKQRDLSFCEIFKEEKKRNLCRDRIFFEKAQEERHEYCKKIRDPKTKELCENWVKIEMASWIKEKRAECNKITDRKLKTFCWDIVNFHRAKESKNLEICDVISVSILQAYCKDAIILDLAREKKDNKLCEKMLDPERKKYCKDLIYFLDHKCEKLSHPIKREFCYENEYENER